MWGGEHEARTPVDTGMWALDLEEEEGAAMVWRRLDTRGDPPSPRSASRDTFRAEQLFFMDRVLRIPCSGLDTGSARWAGVSMCSGAGRARR